MLQALESRHGLTSYAVTTINDLDLPALVALMEAAWQADYREQVRLVFDEAFLRWIMVEPGWVGVLLCTPAGQPVGFEMALARTLYCQQHTVRAYYASLFTVSLQHRRQGLGRWLLENLNHLVFAERRADLIFSTFHAGHAGSPTVQYTYDQIPDWGVQSFHTSPIWGLRLKALPPVRVALQGTRVVLYPGATSLTPRPESAGQPAPVLPTVTALNTALRQQYQVAFGPGESFRTQYLAPDTPQAGTFWYEFDHPAHCAMSFHITPIAIHIRRLGLLGQIHTVHASDCTALHLRQALQHLCEFFRHQRCYGATILDQGVIPHGVLHALDFQPTADRLVFAVRGPQAAIAPFAAVSPPYCLDFS
jgi:GNAT superfamily N-acetyltransferase